MSIRTLSVCRLTCDSCGAERDALSLGATSARIAASAESWKYTEYDIRGKGLQTRKPDPERAGSWTVEATPRQWDSCSRCPVPSAEEAKAIVQARKVASRPVRTAGRGD